MRAQRYIVAFAPGADRQLRKLAEEVQRRIVRAVELLEQDPRPSGAVKLAGQVELWRIRVGACRVVYTIDDERLVVLVVRVAHRKDVYRG